MMTRPFSRSVAWLCGLVLLLAIVSAPASAHTEHKKKQEAAAQLQRQQQEASPGGQTSAAMQGGPTAQHGQMGEMMGDTEMEADRSEMAFGARLLDWLGRTHPVIVHFPIAFFPAALFTAIVGRRREGFAKPVQFLVVAGGVIAPVAALFGWFDALAADPDPLLTVHRWLGTAIGVAALALGIWAWRRPDSDRSIGMIAGLTVITAAIVAQGWYGGAMVHGIDHMNW
jgi:uncharacterized membrane protein